MDDFSPDAFANRDEPLPVIVTMDHDLSDEAENDDQHHKRDRFRGYTSNVRENIKKVSGKGSEGSSSIQDRLLEK